MVEVAIVNILRRPGVQLGLHLKNIWHTTARFKKSSASQHILDTPHSKKDVKLLNLVKHIAEVNVHEKMFFSDKDYLLNSVTNVFYNTILCIWR